MLPDELKEKIVIYISAGHATYAELHTKFPYIQDADWYTILWDTYQESEYSNILGVLSTPPKKDIPLICLQQRPQAYTTFYHFQPTDTFVLTIAGQNLAYQLRKERKKNYATIATVALSLIAALTGILALFR